MKKLLVVLLSLGLIVGFSAAASAATTMSLAGTYELRGSYDNNSVLGDPGYSRANVWQRVRFMPTFNIAEGLSFTARMDALEKQWGNTSWKTNTVSNTSNNDETSSRKTAATNADVKTQESFEFERSYVDFKTKMGQFIIGYQQANTWGTSWGDGNTTRPRVRWQMPFGPVTALVVWEKLIDRDNMGYTPTGKVDADGDIYHVAGIYKQGPLEAGLLMNYTLVSTSRLLGANPFRSKFYTAQPYVKATMGPLYVEAEFDYVWGTSAEYENETPAVKNISKEGMAAYALAKYTMGPAYFGAGVGYLSGDNDNGTGGTVKEKDKTSGMNGKDWNPALIMGNNDMPDNFPAHTAADDAGPTSAPAAFGATGSGMGYDSKKQGTITYNIFAGYKVTPALQTDISFTMAQTSVKFKPGMYLGQATGKFSPGLPSATEYVSSNIGSEIDITATYKIFDNLTYMIGAGYMFTGDFFKGTDPNKKIGDDYLLTNRLTMNF